MPCQKKIPIRSLAAHAMIDAVVAIGVDGKETEENVEEETKTRWPVMQLMDGGVAIVGYPQLHRVMIFGTNVSK
jgi:hypothetical protein